MSDCKASSEDKYNAESKAYERVCDFDESTRIIVELIKTNELPQILAEYNQESLGLLLKNFSPAEMAFEAEVLNHENPVLLLFYNQKCCSSKNILEKIAREYKDAIKCVAIDNDQLFRISENSEVDIFPTYMLIYQREEWGRVEGEFSDKWVYDLLQKIDPSS